MRWSFNPIVFLLVLYFAFMSGLYVKLLMDKSEIDLCAKVMDSNFESSTGWIIGQCATRCSKNVYERLEKSIDGAKKQISEHYKKQRENYFR